MNIAALTRPFLLAWEDLQLWTFELLASPK